MEIASLALLKGDKLLIVRDKYQNFWTLPGGKIERGETRKEAVVREMEEELPLIEWDDLSFYREFFGMTPHSREFVVVHVFIADYSKGFAVPHQEITGSRWVSPGLVQKKGQKIKMTTSTQNIINLIKITKAI